MVDQRYRAWVLPAMMMLVTVVVASTAIRIEWYNHAVGGFLPRSQPPSMEGNDVKWRTTSQDMAEKSFRRSLAYERGLDLSDEEISSMALSADEQREIKNIRQRTKLMAEFRSLVASMGLLQYLLVIAGLLLSWKVLSDRSKHLMPVGGVCLTVNILACGLMFYREYYPSLGY